MNIHVEKSLLSLVPLKSQFSRSTRIDQDELGGGNFSPLLHSAGPFCRRFGLGLLVLGHFWLLCSAA